MNPTTVEVQGHRGSRGTHPENTLVSFEEAKDAGAAFVELDVHLSRDEEVIVFHDPEITDLLCSYADGRPVIPPVALRQLSRKEICSQFVYSKRHPKFQDQAVFRNTKIPSLEEVLKWAKKVSLGINIEMKYSSTDMRTPDRDFFAKRVLDCVEKADMKSSVVIQSFDEGVLRSMRALTMDLSLSYLFDTQEDYIAKAEAIGAKFIAPHFSLVDTDLVLKARDKGIELIVWTVNEESDWCRIIGDGVARIITDYPRKLMQFISRSRNI